MKRARAFAPASIGNVSIGFDILGMAISGVGDEAIVSVTDEPGVRIEAIQGVVQDLPASPEKNTAGAALLALKDRANFKKGFSISLKKGIPLGSGMGGSAASAVAAVVAANSLLKKKLSKEILFECAIEGERVASGAAHPDNVAPCLYGGLTLASLDFWDFGDFNRQVVELPVPSRIFWILIHPEILVETKVARGILSSQVGLQNYVQQTARLASFVSGLFRKDLQLIRQGFLDSIIEPQREHLIPGFQKIKNEIRNQKGVLGFSISGSGPSLFAWTESRAAAVRVGAQVKRDFESRGVPCQVYLGRGAARGAHVL